MDHVEESEHLRLDDSRGLLDRGYTDENGTTVHDEVNQCLKMLGDLSRNEVIPTSGAFSGLDPKSAFLPLRLPEHIDSLSFFAREPAVVKESPLFYEQLYIDCCANLICSAPCTHPPPPVTPDPVPSRVQVIYTTAETGSVPGKFSSGADAFLSGYSIVINHADRLNLEKFSILNWLANDYANRLHLPYTYAQVYITPNFSSSPASSKGSAVGAHNDDRDVIVIQIAGSKHWVAHSPTKNAAHGIDQIPTHNQQVGKVEGRPVPDAFFEVADEDDPSTLRCQLRAGQKLYLPRGAVHWATTEKDTSVHVTLAIPTHENSLASIVDRLKGRLTDVEWKGHMTDELVKRFDIGEEYKRLNDEMENERAQEIFKWTTSFRASARDECHDVLWHTRVRWKGGNEKGEHADIEIAESIEDSVLYVIKRIKGCKQCEGVKVSEIKEGAKPGECILDDIGVLVLCKKLAAVKAIEACIAADSDVKKKANHDPEFEGEVGVGLKRRRKEDNDFES